MCKSDMDILFILRHMHQLKKKQVFEGGEGREKKNNRNVRLFVLCNLAQNKKIQMKIVTQKQQKIK